MQYLLIPLQGNNSTATFYIVGYDPLGIWEEVLKGIAT